ncbi:7085_t:CDS:1 [Scutellospora calospora]|uniref:7085_t:CDS:1 n=1 Tax=Scutellospora calospora TaxID=85575 RepID=A0ACA9JZG1_9GLOM|nr:7085_t:CDS:1 [Scutellospora calospora]
MCYSIINNKHSGTVTLASFPDDILYIISKDLDFLSILALRSTCRMIYLSFSNEVTFSHVSIPSISHDQFVKIFSHLKSTHKLSFIRKFTFNDPKIKAEDVISILENCENLQYLYILGCKEVKLLPITTAMKNWYQESEIYEKGVLISKKRKLQKLKKIVMTRCIGGKRHSLLIKKVLEDIQLLKYHQQQHEEFCNVKRYMRSINLCHENQINSHDTSLFINTNNTFKNQINYGKKDDTNDGIFQFRSCSDLSCEPCILKCAGCGTKYKYWDEFWIKCGWCKDRHFCGDCVMEASKKNVFKTYTFQFMKIKLCQLFDLPCPY